MALSLLDIQVKNAAKWQEPTTKNLKVVSTVDNMKYLSPSYFVREQKS
jgi:hypothetical protein